MQSRTMSLKSNSLRRPQEELDKAILAGDFSAVEKVKKNILRVFIVASPKDTEIEREYLMKEIFPPLRSFCAQYGVHLRFVDLQRGIDHSTALSAKAMDLYSKELTRCFSDSVPGPCFLFISSDDYGECPLPHEIESSEMDKLLASISEGKERNVVKSFYSLDENAVPPCYVLLPERKENHNEDPVDKEEHFRRNFSLLNKILRKAASVSWQLTAQQQEKWNMSITERLVRQALSLQAQYKDKICAVVVPTKIQGRETAKPKLEDESYIEVLSKVEELRKLALEKMKCVGKIKVKFSADETTQNATSDRLKEFGTKFISSFQSLLHSGFQNMLQLSNLAEEVSTHLHDSINSAGEFFGRQALLNQWLSYFDKDDGNRAPLVIYGENGSGRSTALSKLAMEARGYLKKCNIDDCILVVRYCCSTPQSSDTYLLMRSICEQIARVLNRKCPSRGVKFNEMIDLFAQHLQYGEKSRPILIFLDSLHYLNHDDEAAYDYRWLPSILPPYCFVVVTTSPHVGGCLRNLQEMSCKWENFIEVKELTEDESSEIFGSLLQRANRVLTPLQLVQFLNIIKNKTEGKTNVLRLRMLFKLAVKYRSDEEVKDVPVTLSALIDQYFSNLESKHGVSTVRAVFSFLALTCHCLCEKDILDLLSHIDKLQSGVANHPRQENKRFPHLWLTQLRAEIGCFILDSGPYGKEAWRLSNSCIRERVKELYLRTHGKMYAGLLRDYLSGKLQGVSKDTELSPQPLYWDTHAEESSTVFNFQKLNELPTMVLNTNTPSDIETYLCNLQFIAAKTTAGYGPSLMNDFKKAIKFGHSRRLREYSFFISSRIHILDPNPHLLLQEAVNMPNSNFVAREAEGFLEKPTEVFPWDFGILKEQYVRHVNKPFGCQPCLMSLDTQSKGARIVKFWNEQYLVCLCSKNILSVWNIETGINCKAISVPIPVDNFDLQVIPRDEEAGESQNSTKVTAANIACACENGDIYLWRVTISETASAVLLSRWNAHPQVAKTVPLCVAFTHSEESVLATASSTGSKKGELKLWEVSSLSPSRYQHPANLITKYTSDLKGISGNCEIVALQFVLNGRFVVIGVIDGNWKLVILICSYPTLKVRFVVRCSDYSCPYFSQYEFSPSELYLIISLLGPSGEAIDAALLKLDVREQSSLAGSLFQLPCRGLCRFLTSWYELMVINRGRITLYSIGKTAQQELQDCVLGKHDIDWKDRPVIELQETKAAVIPHLRDGEENDLPLVGHGSASRWDVLGSLGIAAIGSPEDVIKLIGLEQLRTMEQSPAHESRVLACLKIPDSNMSFTCALTPYPSTKVWDSENGLLLQSFTNEGVLFAAFSSDLTKILYVKEHSSGKSPAGQMALHVADVAVFRNSMKQSGFPDLACSVIILIPRGKIEGACFSPDNNFIALHYFEGGSLYVVSLARKEYLKLPIENDSGAVALQSFSDLPLYKPTFFLPDSGGLVVWNYLEADSGSRPRLSRSVWKLEGGCIRKGLFPERRCWVISTYKVIRLFAEEYIKRKAMVVKSQVGMERTFYFTGASELPSTDLVVTATHDGFLQLRDRETVEVKVKVAVENQRISFVLVTEDSKHIVTSSREGWIKVWNTFNLKQIGAFHSDAGVNSLSVFISSSGRLMINFGDNVGQFQVLEVHPYTAKSG